MSFNHTHWGYEQKMKYVLIQEAPLTASGRNEILFGAVTKKDLILIAKVMGLKVTGRFAPYKIIKIDEA